jgi:hypothetical protein
LLAGTRILLVEDEPLVRRSVAAQLEKLGCEVVTVESAWTALRTLSTDGLKPLSGSKIRAGRRTCQSLARAHRRQRILESGDFGSVAELAGAEKINLSYFAQVLRLTLLSPEQGASIRAGSAQNRLTARRAPGPFGEPGIGQVRS